MKAILLAAGFGTRLKPLTDSIPKCLVPIKGRPLLEIWLEKLSGAGVEKILVNSHYLSDKVEDFISSSSYKDQVIVIREGILLGTAGTLIANLDFFGECDGLLAHADNYTLANLHEFVNVHNSRPENCLMTMMVFHSDNPQSCGIVELNDKNIVIGFHEKIANPPGNLANGAVYILSLELLRMIKSDFSNCEDFSTEILPRLIGKIFTYKTNAAFLDIGTPDTYLKANSI